MVIWVFLAGVAPAGTVAPVLQSVEIDPGTADVTAGPVEVVVRARVSDDVSGLALGFVTFYDAAGGVKADVYFDEFELVSGDALDGTYEVPVEVPGFAVAGVWELEVFLADLNNNFASYGRAGLALPGGASGELTVVNSGVADETGPVVAGFSADVAGVDVTAGPGRVVLGFSVSDAGSGFANGAVFLEKDGVRAGFLVDDLHRVTGDESAGDYRVAYWIPEGAPAGTYRWNVQATDAAGNVADVDFGGAETVVVTNAGVAEVGIFGDGPVLESFGFGPAAVDVSAGGGEVSGVIGFSDDATGLASARVVLTGPTGDDVVVLELSEADVVGGVIPFAFDVPRWSEAGDWTVEVSLRDRADNETLWGGDFGEAPPGGEVGLAVANSVVPGFSVAAVRVVPGSVDVTGGAVEVAVEVDVVGEISGGRFSTAVAGGAFGGDDGLAEGTYGFGVVVPAGAAAGDWAIGVVLEGEGGEVAWRGGVLTVVDGAEDFVAPVVVGYTGVAGAVDITGAPAMVVLRVEVEDGGSGAGQVGVRLVHGASGKALGWAVATEVSPGVWECGYVVPAGSEDGHWFAEVEVGDLTGNVRAYGGVGAFSAVLPGGGDVVAVTDGGTEAYAAFAANFGVGAIDGDDDGDGMENGLELLFGRDPTAADGWAPDVVVGGGQAVLTFRVDRDALEGSAGEAIAWRGLGSTDFGDWTELVAEPLGAGRYRVRGGGFLRIGAGEPATE